MNLIISKSTAITIDQVPEEIQQFRFVVTGEFVLVFYYLAHSFDKFQDLGLIVQHILIVVVHLLKEIDAADVFVDVVHHFVGVWDQG